MTAEPATPLPRTHAIVDDDRASRYSAQSLGQTAIDGLGCLRIPHRRLLLAALTGLCLPLRAQVKPLQVASASSLVDVMPGLARGFEAANAGVLLQWRSGGSGLLLDELAQAAAIDVLLSADGDTIARGVQRQLLRADSVRAFAGNELVLLVPAASKLPIRRLADLTRPEVQRIALASATQASVGRYARQAIDAVRLWASVQRKIVAADSARAALQMLLRDEADAALLYRTDGLAAGSAVREVERLSGHEPIRLTAAVAQASTQPERAAAFVQYLRSESARSQLVAQGFSVL